MRFLLRPVCWRRGHLFTREEWWEAMPVPMLVCSRCLAHAPDEIAVAHLAAFLAPADEAK